MIARIGVNEGGLGALFVMCAVVTVVLRFVIIVGSLVLHLALLRAGEFDGSSQEPGGGTTKATSDVDATINS